MNRSWCISPSVFLGGDLDPHWYGYGYVGMALLGVFYAVAAVVSQLLGISSSVLEFASGLFDGGFFITSARFIFALIGAFTICLYVKTGIKLGIHPLLLALFAAVSLVSQDGMYFANYIRCDQIVGFWCAFILYRIVTVPPATPARVSLPLSCAAAVHSKMSALPLACVLPMRAYEGGTTWKRRASILAVYVTVFLIGAILFNPFDNLPATIANALHMMVFEPVVTVSKPAYFGPLEVSKAIAAVLVKFVGMPMLALLALSPFLFVRHTRAAIYAACCAAALVAPYYTTPQIAEYWFIPLFPLLRFLAIASLDSLFRIIARSAPGFIRGGAAASCVIGLWLWVVPGVRRYCDFAESVLRTTTNAAKAKEWLLHEIAEGRTVLLDTHFNFLLPKVYGTDLFASKEISSAFIYNRDRNEFLHRAFEYFHANRYLPRLGAAGPVTVRKVPSYDTENGLDERRKRAGAYFVASPAAYDRFLSHSGERLSPQARNTQLYLVRYYREVLTNRKIAEFSGDSGPVIEVYELSAP